jgi:biotin carboxylase
VPTVLLILPSATYRAAEFIDAANELGASVVIGSNTAPVFESGATGSFLQLDLDDPEAAAKAIVELDQRVPIDAVVGVDDQGLLTAAIAGNQLGLVTNSPTAVAATRNKVAMRELLAISEVHQPSFRPISRSEGDVESSVVVAATELGYPVVIKPSNQAASRGVIRANDADEARRATRRILAMLESDDMTDQAPLLVEGFVHGEEIAIEGLLSDGELTVLAVFDKPDPLDGPYFEETIYVTPSRHDASVLATAETLVEQACRAMGLVTGPIHAEVRLASDEDGKSRPVVLEVAARTIGGRCAQALSFSRGRSLEAIVLEHALSRSLADDAHRSFGASGVMMLPIPASGRLIEVHNKERALKVPGITGLEISIAPGKPIYALPEGNRYLGFLFAKAVTPTKVEAALRRAHAELNVEIEQDPQAVLHTGIA